MSDAAHLAAVLTAINASLSGSRTAYAVDDVPTPRPAEYVEVVVARRAGETPRFVGRTGRTGWRVVTRPCSSVSMANVSRMQAEVADALDGTNLLVGSEYSTPVVFETADPVTADENWLSAPTAWTYAL